jgi:hypothetical protein
MLVAAACGVRSVRVGFGPRGRGPDPHILWRQNRGRGLAGRRLAAGSSGPAARAVAGSACGAQCLFCPRQGCLHQAPSRSRAPDDRWRTLRANHHWGPPVTVSLWAGRVTAARQAMACRGKRLALGTGGVPDEVPPGPHPRGAGAAAEECGAIDPACSRPAREWPITLTGCPYSTYSEYN